MLFRSPDPPPVRIGKIIVGEGIGNALSDDFGSLCQLMRRQLLDNSPGFFPGCLFVLRGMDRFQHPGHAFDLAFGNNGRHIVVKMQNTFLFVLTRDLTRYFLGIAAVS